MKTYILSLAFKVLSKFSHDPAKAAVLSQMADEMREVDRLGRTMRRGRPIK